MNIYKMNGFECEKALSTTVEDLFNQSEVEYEQEGQRKVLTVIYVRYFDEYVQEQGIYDAQSHGIAFYHLFALLVFMNNADFPDGKRIYINQTDQFLKSFHPEHIEKALDTYRSLSSETKDLLHEGRNKYDIDEDRMVNEGLAGGQTQVQGGHIGQTTIDDMQKKKD